jgi:hypothetical protein
MFSRSYCAGFVEPDGQSLARAYMDRYSVTWCENNIDNLTEMKVTT